jgi:hypothetical protein
MLLAYVGGRRLGRTQVEGGDGEVLLVKSEDGYQVLARWRDCELRTGGGSYSQADIMRWMRRRPVDALLGNLATLQRAQETNQRLHPRWRGSDHGSALRAFYNEAARLHARFPCVSSHPYHRAEPLPAMEGTPEAPVLPEHSQLWRGDEAVPKALWPWVQRFGMPDRGGES